ncbi:hypothetical protein [Staphylococcus simiae]|uniref:Phage protein n=1 Tax=Staphylococcus simiae CCM 7213 = CCUG 51256 TaxID=911238 RepID=G5JH58_9STAP|nr:hypothetical protein [Staphylococcus simiae]EHJ08406.1 hypothetical protein SS7213T_03935 [Staphylococcus simiae CCM 7213 = CCUG 51256]PNZ12634.1 hypothetical protein CD113_06360 [Staphylococcus simiae]SNV67042.1 hypothetical phage-related protein [Staphylococcus simiae]
MNMMQYKELLKKLYEETKDTDPIVARIYIETGWAINRLLERNEITVFDDYDKVKDKIMNETKWRHADGTYRKVLPLQR